MRDDRVKDLAAQEAFWLATSNGHHDQASPIQHRRLHQDVNYREIPNDRGGKVRRTQKQLLALLETYRANLNSPIFDHVIRISEGRLLTIPLLQEEQCPMHPPWETMIVLQMFPLRSTIE